MNRAIQKFIDERGTDPLEASFERDRAAKDDERRDASLPPRKALGAVLRDADQASVQQQQQLGGVRLEDATLARTFVLAGHAIFTLVSKRTGERLTFKFSRPKPEDDGRVRTRVPIFVNLLVGPDNTSDYLYLGQIWESANGYEYQVGRKSRVGADAASQKAAAWLAKALNYPEKLTQCEIYHEGRCARCGRRLTVPESIRTGFGPECAGRI